MIPPEFINQKAGRLTDEQLFSCLKDSIFQACKMITLQAKPEHSRIVFDGIIHIIRSKFNDLTAGNLDTAIQMGLYGNYGDYTKCNPKTILTWFSKKRLEVSQELELKEQYRNKTEDNDFIFSANGGKAVLLGLCYDSMNITMPFQDRLKLIETNGICPHTNKKVSQLIQESIVQNNLTIGKKI